MIFVNLEIIGEVKIIKRVPVFFLNFFIYIKD